MKFLNKIKSIQLLDTYCEKINNICFHYVSLDGVKYNLNSVDIAYLKRKLEKNVDSHFSGFTSDWDYDNNKVNNKVNKRDRQFI